MARAAAMGGRLGKPLHLSRQLTKPLAQRRERGGLHLGDGQPCLTGEELVLELAELLPCPLERPPEILVSEQGDLGWKFNSRHHLRDLSNVWQKTDQKVARRSLTAMVMAV